MPRAAKLPKEIPPHRVTILMVANGGLRGLTDHLPDFFKGAWPAILILSGSSFIALLSMSDPSKYESLPTQTIVDFVMLFAIGLVLAASFGVSWRRYLILGTKPSCFYFGRGFWSFIGRTFLAMLGYMLIFLVTFGVLFALGYLAHLVHFPKGAIAKDDFIGLIKLIVPIVLITFVGFIPAWWWLARHMPYFAAKAVEDDSVTWRSIYPLMRGNVWPYMVGATMAVIPLYFGQIFIQFAATSIFKTYPTAGDIAQALIWQVSTLGMIAISASIGATLYKRVIKNETMGPDYMGPLPLDTDMPA